MKIGEIWSWTHPGTGIKVGFKVVKEATLYPKKPYPLAVVQEIKNPERQRFVAVAHDGAPINLFPSQPPNWHLIESAPQ